MNILFITHSLGYAGAEKMVAFVANQLSLRGHNVGLINLNLSSQEVAQKIEDSVKFFNIAGKGMGRLQQLKQIIKIARQEKAQLLVGFKVNPNLLVCLAGKLLGIPSIMSERGDPNRTFEKNWRNRLLRWFINRCSGGVFQTAEAGAFYGKGLQRRGTVIPNPIFIKGDVPQVSMEEREKTVVSVGRLDNMQKRYDVMLEAFSLFVQKHPEYMLKLYGDGSDEARIRQWVQEKGLADKVLFMGRTNQPMQDTCRDGMFLITSDYEGISNALLEAMAVGLPCVSTDHTPGGARLLIQHEENGLLAPIGDAQALADAMCRFSEDSVLACHCGEKAKEVVERFHPDRIIDRWETYCKKVVGIKN